MKKDDEYSKVNSQVETKVRGPSRKIQRETYLRNSMAKLASSVGQFRILISWEVLHHRTRCCVYWSWRTSRGEEGWGWWDTCSLEMRYDYTYKWYTSIERSMEEKEYNKKKKKKKLRRVVWEGNGTWTFVSGLCDDQEREKSRSRSLSLSFFLSLPLVGLSRDCKEETERKRESIQTYTPGFIMHGADVSDIREEASARGAMRDVRLFVVLSRDGGPRKRIPNMRFFLFSSSLILFPFYKISSLHINLPNPCYILLSPVMVHKSRVITFPSLSN